ncbi:MAG: hypothetical protein ABR907_05715 [Terracidiphilus sp.]|jgi:hypothetical protein
MTLAPQTLLFGVFLVGLVAALIVNWRSLLKQRQREWHELVASLQQVDFVGVSTVATDYLSPHRGQIDLEPDKIWECLGGYEGLRKMRQNADIMLALAAWAQQWNFEEAVIVTERMRHDAALLRRAVRRVEFGMIPVQMLQRFRFTLPLHAQEASSAYYLMRQRLLSLYETSHVSRYPALAASL